MAAAPDLAIAFALAVAVDLAVGDPTNRFHPVAWLGRIVAPIQSRAGASTPPRELAGGVTLAVVVPLAWTSAWLVVLSCTQAIPALHVALSVFLLKSTFAIRGLGRAALLMASALERRELATARRGLSHLCSRPAEELGADQLAQGTIESVAENASDSAVAPFFYLALFGLPGALFYRAVNTLDAMVGYHGRFEYLGKATARLDDILNWVPARITALLLLVAGTGLDTSSRRGYQTLREHGPRTPSPNAGRPMAAMAGLLSIALTKPGVYTLGRPLRPVVPGDIRTAWRIAHRAMVGAAILTAVVLLLRASAISP